MRTVWTKVGNTLHQTVEGSHVIMETPENKVYNICQNPNTGEIYLEELFDGFKFPEKIYGLESEFMNYVEDTYKATTSNLGILLDGKKGTGKTVTAELLAMRFKLPILLVPSPFNGLQDFISKFSCECVFFFDEFEKTFGSNRRDNDGVTSMLLSVMDGTYNTIKRQIFILTTNNTYIDENFLGRPSRIRYHKTFGNLRPEIVTEITNDLLIDKSRTQDVLELVDSLALSTIDTLKAIITDINIHPNASTRTIREFLNLEFATHRYQIITKRLDEDDEKYSTYTIKDLEGELSQIGTTYSEEDNGGETREYEYTESDFGIYHTFVNCGRSIAYCDLGDEFFGGNIVKPLDSTNCLVVERYDGTRYFIKVLNPDNRPSLYGSLMF